MAGNTDVVHGVPPMVARTRTEPKPRPQVAPYGKSAADRQRVREVEPLSRRTAHHEVAPTEPLDEVASTVLRLAGAAA